ncbi:cytochrome c nitrite reductase pentaheme subunit [Actinobacillus equuli]|uniref:cytochrome c nitrite reductase pentaheme subunit n=1 Tax=Actinobacillus equuli TaxID=718 RepID=UPI002441F4FF|nr:cytochrome c nitrite reductase pentaheme subunit [Actinobacillus equuli]WGE58393.1 cytochrome c nitrite reductase pentaheme subunit [Actinobacillus equuli subsp. haemolyticus]WGE61017.1 cytochrome c nitrite reductase pentaheme subunit [Actinobacillus equuli subsp. haemolyticus]
MKNIISKAGRAIALQAVVFASFFAISTASQAEMPQQPKPLWTEQASDAQIAEDARRDPNKYCVQCHESANATGKPFHHAGKHFQKDVKSPNNGEPITCVSCHGNISENHRKGVKDVMRFNPHGKASNPSLERSVNEQNQVCVACHTADKLREKLRAHDTHATKISCTNCHELHLEKEPMKDIPEKQRIKLCTDCHTKIHAGEFKTPEMDSLKAKENK